MATTTSDNLYDKEVLEAMVQAKLPHAIVLNKFVTYDNKMMGAKGKTVTVPYYKHSGAARDYEEGETIEADKLVSSKREYTVKKSAKDIDAYDEALEMYDDPQGEIVRQIVSGLALRKDARILEAMNKTSQVYNGTAGVISYDGIVKASGLFNEEIKQEKVMFISPAQYEQIALDPKFIDKTKYGNDVMFSGEIGMIYGVRIVCSRQIKKLPSQSATQGIVKLQLSGAVEKAGKIFINGDEVISFTKTDGLDDIATSLATALASYDTNYTAAVDSTVDTLVVATQKVGGVGQDFADVKATGGVKITSWVDTEGVLALGARYECPIMQITFDEETQNPLPPLKIYPWTNATIEHFRRPREQKHEFTSAENYVVALTDDTKVVKACFKDVPASSNRKGNK